jgi:sugar lactone lactonase YvrE
VAVRSNEPFAQVVSPVVVPGGTNTTTFPITTSYVYPANTATIYATVAATTLSAKLTVTPGNPLSTGPWPKYAADMGNSGRSKYGGAKGKLKWTLDFHGGAYSAPTMGNNEIGIETSQMPDPNFLIFSLSGTLLQKVPLPQYNFYDIVNPVGNPVAAADGTFYVPVVTGLEAISPTGKVLWTCAVSASTIPLGTPCIGGNGTIYLRADELSAISPAGKLLWRYAGLNGVNIVAGPDGTVYAVDGAMTAISPAGKLKWTLNPGYFSGAVVGSDGTVYVGGADGSDKPALMAVSPEGSIIWTYETPYGVTSTPVIGANGSISFLAGGTLLTVTSSGKLAWSYNLPGVEGSLLSVGPDASLYAASSGLPSDPSKAEVCAISAEGKARWALATPYGLPRLPLGLADGSVYLTSSYGGVSAYFNPYGQGLAVQGASGSRFLHVLPTGKPDWTFYGGGPVAPVSIDANGLMYAACAENLIQTVLPNGTLGWQYETSSPPTNTPTLGGDGTVYVGTQDGTVYALLPTGEKKWSYKLPAAVTAAIALGSDGSVYVSCSNAVLYDLSLTGALKWKFAAVVNQNFLSTIPAIGADGTIYYLNYALYPGGGVKWQAIADAGGGTPSIGNDGAIYYGGNAGVGVSSSGQVLWQVGNNGLGYALVPPTGAGYFTSMCGFAQTAANPDDVGWSFPSFQWAPSIPGTGALDNGGTIYVPGQAIWNSATPQLFALDSGGKVIWQLPDSNAGSFGTSIGADGTVYMVSANSVLYAID